MRGTRVESGRRRRLSLKIDFTEWTNGWWVPPGTVPPRIEGDRGREERRTGVDVGHLQSRQRRERREGLWVHGGPVGAFLRDDPRSRKRKVDTSPPPTPPRLPTQQTRLWEAKTKGLSFRETHIYRSGIYPRRSITHPVNNFLTILKVLPLLSRTSVHRLGRYTPRSTLVCPTCGCFDRDGGLSGSGRSRSGRERTWYLRHLWNRPSVQTRLEVGWERKRRVSEESPSQITR